MEEPTVPYISSRYERTPQEICNEKWSPEARMTVVLILRNGSFIPHNTIQYLQTNSITSVLNEDLKVRCIEAEGTVSNMEKAFSVGLWKCLSLERVGGIAYGLEYKVSLTDIKVPSRVYKEVDYIIGTNGCPVFITDDRRIECGAAVVELSSPFDLGDDHISKSTSLKGAYEHRQHVLDDLANGDFTTVYFTQNTELGVYEVLKQLAHDGYTSSSTSSSSCVPYGMRDSFKRVFRRLLGETQFVSEEQSDVVKPLAQPHPRWIPIASTSSRHVKPTITPRPTYSVRSIRDIRSARGTTLDQIPNRVVSFILSEPPQIRRREPQQPHQPRQEDAKVVGLPSRDTGASISTTQSMKTVTFFDDIEKRGQRVLERLWEFGDGTHSTDSIPVHTYPGYGTYQVKMKAIVDYTSSAIHSLIVTTTVTLVQSTIAASFFTKNTNGKAPYRVYFENASAGNISSMKWDFGDGTVSTDASPDHLYETPGDYTVSLIVTSDDDKSDVFTRKSYIRIRR